MPAKKLLRRLAILLLALPVAAFAADTITGTVTNRTTNKPSAGDDVVLIRLAQGMQESTRTTTDARGHFSLDVPDPGVHLVRVTHDKANYFKPAPPGTQIVDIDVYNAAAHVKGVASEADVMRIQSDASGASLHVVENFFIKNDSAPPMTQFSNAPFDFWLPDGAVVEGSAALAPGGMPVQAAPVPLAEKNHYTFLFPLRPGETRFQVSYHLPYSGKLTLTPRVGSPTDTIAIMLPKSMTFAQAAGTPYSAVTDEPTAQTYVARNVMPDQPLAFTLSGNGQLPRDADAPDQGAGQNTQATDNNGQPLPETQNTMPGKGLQNPLDPNGDREPVGKYKWWILAGFVVLLVIAAGLLLRKPATPLVAAAAPQLPPAPLPPGWPPSATGLTPFAPGSQHVQLLQTLKEELFALETDHLQNRISDADYAAQKAALEIILRRALQRNQPPPAV